MRKADQVRLDWRGDRHEPLPNSVRHPSIVADDPRDLGAHEVELLASTLVEDVGHSVVDPFEQRVQVANCAISHGSVGWQLSQPAEGCRSGDRHRRRSRQAL